MCVTVNREAREAVGDYKAGWHDPENSTIRFDFGLSEEVVREISALKGEPGWMTETRVKFYKMSYTVCLGTVDLTGTREGKGEGDTKET